MKALVIRGYGQNDVVRLEDMPEPTVGPRDVLIEVRSASLNPIDFKIRGGKLKAIRKYAFPLILGCDVSGVVREAGPEVTRFKVGDAVFARLEKDRMGGFAERVAANEDVVARKPDALDHDHAAALPLVGLTSWQALTEIASVEKGNKVLIHAGAGGIGTVAIQLAKHLGATVATTTSAKNAPLVKSLGADIVVDYTREDFTKVLSDYDVVFETLGVASEIRSVGVLKRGGVMVAIGGMPDAAWARANGMSRMLVFGLGLLNWRRTRALEARGVRFTYLFMRPDGAQLGHLGDLAQAGKLKVIVDRTFPLGEGKAALAYLEAGHARGKVVIKMK
jgi:alcohol dehydrogenase